MSLLRRAAALPTRVTRGALTEAARFLRIETVGGTILLLATALALAWANSPWAGSYLALRDLRVGPAVVHLDLTLGQWAAEGLLAVFFFVAGLELKRELVTGELARLRSAALPVFAAVGGIVVPAAVMLAVSAGAPGTGQAWAVPVATDIAFALGVLALLGSRLPSSARVFLLSLAVVDDLGAIILIAVLFTDDLSLSALAAAVALAAGYAGLQALRVRTSVVYVPLALATWVAVHEAGLHATVAGVALGLLTRVRPDAGEHEPPGLRLEHRLQPVSAGFAVPVFALSAAGIPLGADALARLATDRVALAIAVALPVGKLIGILGSCALAVRLRLAARAPDLDWGSLAVVAILGGVGFTVSLLIAELAVQGPALVAAKAAVLLGSALAALAAVVLSAVVGRRGGSTHRAQHEVAQ